MALAGKITWRSTGEAIRKKNCTHVQQSLISKGKLTGGTPYKCSVYGKGRSERTYLISQESTHTQEKYIKCVCSVGKASISPTVKETRLEKLHIHAQSVEEAAVTYEKPTWGRCHIRAPSAGSFGNESTQNPEISACGKSFWTKTYLRIKGKKNP
ncbi:hypothetical protein E2320_014504, partial [Naja naja]